MQEDWLAKTLKKLDKACEKHNDKTLNTFKTKALRKVIKRLAEFSEQSCKKCTACKAGIKDCIEIINSYEGDKKQLKHYNTVMKNIVMHLKKVHGLIEEGTYLALSFPIGICVGVVANALYPEVFSYAISLSVGIALGLGIGSMLDKRAKQQGRVI